MAAGLGTLVWPSVLSHSSEFAITHGVQVSLLAGLGACAALGLRYPLAMLPILLFEVLWKSIYLLAFALPLWRAHAITPSVSDDITAVAMVVILLPLIPWDELFARFVRQPGDPWRSR